MRRIEPDVLGRVDKVGAVLDGGEVVENDAVAGDHLTVHLQAGRGLGRRRGHRRGRDENSEAGCCTAIGAAQQQPLAGFEHRREVAGSPHRDEHDGWARHLVVYPSTLVFVCLS
jgi:hypothetical protein